MDRSPVFSRFLAPIFVAALLPIGPARAAVGECAALLEDGRKAYNERRYDDAITHFEKAGAACPDRKAALFGLAKAQLMAKRFDKKHLMAMLLLLRHLKRLP